jgi:hypothetical protein
MIKSPVLVTTLRPMKDAWPVPISYAKDYPTVDVNPISVNKSFSLPLRSVMGQE